MSKHVALSRAKCSSLPYALQECKYKELKELVIQATVGASGVRVWSSCTNMAACITISPFEYKFKSQLLTVYQIYYDAEVGTFWNLSIIFSNN